MKPDSWENIRIGGKMIKDKTGIPVGIGLSAELDTAMAMRAIMYSFGAHEQDVEGNLTLNSKETLEALKFVKALFEQTETPEVFAWDPSSNNRQMLAGRSSLVLNAISITRAGENDKLPIHEKIALAKAPKGPVRQIGLEHVMDCYVIWKFAENIDGAKKFLVDYIDNFKQGFLASEFYNFPCFTETVPDLTQIISKDSKAFPRTSTRSSRTCSIGRPMSVIPVIPMPRSTKLSIPGSSTRCSPKPPRVPRHRRMLSSARTPNEGDLGEVERAKDDLISLAHAMGGRARSPPPNSAFLHRSCSTSEVSAMAIVETRRVTKLFDDIRAVDGVDLLAKDGEFLVLLGPSGCGKTHADAHDRGP